MTLRELLGDGPDVVVTGLTFDNRLVAEGTLFFCVPGFTRDGHDFAPDAVARGAAALVVQRPLGLGVPEVLVPDVRAAMAVAAARFYGEPTRTLRVAGITGTNGKTTTAFLTRALLEGAGLHCGLLGTVKSVIGGVEHEVVRTTPEAFDLQRTFRAMLDAGDVACAMEISSHALELKRADGVQVRAAVFTNLNQDHLDFHPTMEDYFQAKRLLFASPLTSERIVNADDPYGRRLIEEFDGTITFGIEAEADYRAVDVSLDGAFTAVTPDGSFAARVPLPGASTCPTRWRRGRLRVHWVRRRKGSRRLWRGLRPRPAASSRCKWASPSTSSSTTRTSRVRWSRCCWPRGNWPPGG